MPTASSECQKCDNGWILSEVEGMKAVKPCILPSRADRPGSIELHPGAVQGMPRLIDNYDSQRLNRQRHALLQDA